jgi:hypothetical protein
MKKCFLFSTLLICWGLVAALPARASEADRNYIRNKLTFFFVANPNAAGAAASTVDVDAVLKSTGTTAFYTSATLAKFRDMIKALVGAGPVANAGDLDILQQVVASTLKITGKPIGVYLIDDSGAKVTNQANQDKFGICLDDSTNRQAWPCASAYTEDDRDKHAWGGNLTLGSWHFKNSAQFAALQDCIATSCHELMHTQDLSDMRLHIFGAFMYGNDQTHYDVEATPDMALTYMEGIANFAAYWYNSNAFREANEWFTANGYLLVEKVVPPGEKAPELLLYKELQKAGISEISPAPANYSANIRANYAFYKIRSLPAKVIVQNEQIVSLALHTHAFYTSFDNVMAAIKDINPSTYRTSSSAWAAVIGRLCTRALPPGRTVAQLGRAEYKEPKKYFLPLAICDYYTSFRSTNKSEFKAVFEDWPTIVPWVDAYWDSGARDDVKHAVKVNAPKVGDVTDMAIALGITSSSP